MSRSLSKPVSTAFIAGRDDDVSWLEAFPTPDEDYEKMSLDLVSSVEYTTGVVKLSCRPGKTEAAGEG